MPQHKSTNHQRVHDALKKRPMSRVELEREIGLGKNSVEKALKRLRDSGVKVETVQTTRTNIVYKLGN